MIRSLILFLAGSSLLKKFADCIILIMDHCNSEQFFYALSSHRLLPLDLPALANGGRVHHHLIDIRRATCQDDERQAQPPSGELALGAVLVHGPRLQGLGRSEHVELRLLEDWTVGDDVHAFAHERA